MLLLFILLFLAFEAVLIKKTDPEPWRHIFNIIYYGFGDAKRYGYYTRTNKIKQVFLDRVRNLNALSREEFDRMPAQQLQEMINSTKREMQKMAKNLNFIEAAKLRDELKDLKNNLRNKK